MCILSAHPVVLTEFQRILSGQAIRLTSRQVQSSLAPDLRHEEIPRAELYVVDGQAGGATTALLANIMDRWPAARLLVIAQMFTAESSYSFLRAGAKALLTYTDAREHLPKALSQVAKGGFWVPRTVLSAFVDSILSAPNGRLKANTATDLSAREQEVLEAVLSNLSNKEIADKLNISERTVKFHVSHLLEKFGVRRRADLIVLWHQRGKPKA